ncbi:hypothetical protein J7E62_30840 [Variovorax paradoxus]|nr:hypothetical protein [Variovorax paradoxus]
MLQMATQCLHSRRDAARIHRPHRCPQRAGAERLRMSKRYTRAVLRLLLRYDNPMQKVARDDGNSLSFGSGPHVRLGARLGRPDT